MGVAATLPHETAMRAPPRTVFVLSTLASLAAARVAKAEEPPVRGAPAVVDVPWSGAEAVPPPVRESAPAPADPVPVAPPTIVSPAAGPKDDGFARPPGEAERLAERPLDRGIVHVPGRGITFAVAYCEPARRACTEVARCGPRAGNHATGVRRCAA